MRFGTLPVILFSLLNSVVWADSPSQPGDLRAEIYSDTAAELFWLRSTDDRFVQGYEISINGNIVALTDGASYFTDSLIKGESYEFLVLAVDDEGNRSDPAAISFTGGGVPSRPGNVTVSIYSRTAAEMFWDREPDNALTYEISIDGTFVATSLGTSFFTDNLAAGQQYDFSVVAIDSGGNRSKTVTVTATTAGEPVGPPTAGPSQPTNAYIIVYSQTAAELFWDRAQAAQNVVTNEISRNGLVIGMAEGNSFFDNTREPGLQYEYGLTAIDASNVRSPTSTLSETRDVPIINRDNYTVIVADVLETYHGGRYKEVEIAKDWILGDVFPEFFTGPIPATVLTCTNGGTANYQGIVALDFSDCQSGDFVFNGPFSYLAGNVAYYGTTVGETLTMQTSQGTRLDFTGRIRSSGLVQYGFDASLESLMLLTPTDVLAIENMDTDFSIGTSSGQQDTFNAYMSGAFDITSSATGGELIQVSSINTFSYSEHLRTHSEPWNFRRGILQLRARDNSRLSLDADTGDDTTVIISIYDNAHGVEQFVLPWSTWDDSLRRIP
ncbi:MAG: hypothetical protein AB8B63_10590 [Granulosicoccus sp.]